MQPQEFNVYIGTGSCILLGNFVPVECYGRGCERQYCYTTGSGSQNRKSVVTSSHTDCDEEVDPGIFGTYTRP